MISDIILPRNNEEDFIKMAKSLGYDSLVFAYPHACDVEKYKKSGIHVVSAVLTPTLKKNLNHCKVILDGGEHVREGLEQKRIHYLVHLEQDNRGDSLRQRNSGLNQILCKLAKKSNVKVVLSVKDLTESKGFNKALRLGRIIQNIRLCRKYGVQLKIASFATNPYQMKSPRDLQSLGLVLGRSSQQAKAAIKL
jgi:hypothetical protein